MRIKKEFMKKNVAGECVIVPMGNTALSFNGLVSLNEVGEFLWDHLQQETDLNHLVFDLMNEYEVDYNTAKQDVVDFVVKLHAASIVE